MSNYQSLHQQERILNLLIKSISKMKKMRYITNNTTKKNNMYEKTKAVRPFVLKVIRNFDLIKHEWVYTNFLQVLYKKSVKWLKDIDTELLYNKWEIKEENYIKSFQKNLKKIKKTCEDTSIAYYSLLPDRIPIDVRTHCVQFISQAKINR